MQKNTFIVEAARGFWKVFQADIRNFASVHSTKALALSHAMELCQSKDKIKVLRQDGSVEMEFG